MFWPLTHCWDERRRCRAHGGGASHGCGEEHGRTHCVLPARIDVHTCRVRWFRRKDGLLWQQEDDGCGAGAGA